LISVALNAVSSPGLPGPVSATGVDWREAQSLYLKEFSQ